MPEYSQPMEDQDEDYVLHVTPYSREQIARRFLFPESEQNKLQNIFLNEVLEMDPNLETFHKDLEAACKKYRLYGEQISDDLVALQGSDHAITAAQMELGIKYTTTLLQPINDDAKTSYEEPPILH